MTVHASEPRPLSSHGHPRGKLSSWALIGGMIAAFAAGGVALIFGVWPIVYAMAGVFVAGVPAGAALRIMDDTVQWTLPPSYRASARDESMRTGREQRGRLEGRRPGEEGRSRAA
ncbi:MAG: hypothetical protein ACRDN9_02860 [Streptosporangiaceae bacterium]